MKVLIDNGHGADTPGKRSPDGSYREGVYMRRLAARLVERLCASGIDAALLTPESRDVPLGERVRRVNDTCSREGTANVVVVSLHSNAAGDGRLWCAARGWSAYTSPGQTRADRLATLLYAGMEGALRDAGYMLTFSAAEAARTALRRDLRDGDPDMEDRFSMLTRTRCAAVLTENLFHDNRADLAWLTSPQGERAIVEGHAQAIIAYVEEQKSR